MDKKKLLLISGIAIVITLIIGLIGFVLYSQFSNSGQEPTPTTNQNTNANQNIGGLTPSKDLIDGQTPGSQILQALEKEKQFISSFWNLRDASYNPQVASYELPFNNIKDQATNYRDFSRRINIDHALPQLTQNGFTVIDDPFNNKTANWEESYRTIKENEVPILITTDSVMALYQDTLGVIYKEIEQEIFYQSLWEVLTDLKDKSKDRYEARFRQFGIEDDLITEANRLELAYVTVALELLKPETNQVKEVIANDENFFTTTDAEIYKFTIPEYLENEVAEEIRLIIEKKPAKSPIFLYQKDYSNFNIPAQYQTSEKLKNYYLATTWINEALFPLWNNANECDNCLLDKQDHSINFLAALLISNDLAQDQNLKNKWANIYKPISFFKGLETNLTYLDYNLAIQELFETNDLETLFTADNETIDNLISSLQEKINSYDFPVSLGGNKDDKSLVGLRLLRNYHLLEDKVLYAFAEPNVGKYSETGLDYNKFAPNTACPRHNTDEFYRCTASGLDFFNVLGFIQANVIQNSSKDNYYDNYQAIFSQFNQEIQSFSQNTWHDNSYMSSLSALQKLNHSYEGYPTFMKTDAWKNAKLTTALGSWVNSHKEINFEKTNLRDNSNFGAYFPYGYVEPEIELYRELLANTEMIIEGFTTLQIINPNSKSYERLDNLKITLQHLTDIAVKELNNIEPNNSDYNFINGFSKQIRSFIGDIKAENLENNMSLTFNYQVGRESERLIERINGLNYMVVVYPDISGNLIMAIGPVFDYSETGRDNKSLSDWQDEYQSIK